MLKRLQQVADRLEASVLPRTSKCCPRCKSTNFEIVAKPSNKVGWLVGGPLLGLSNATQGVCRDCGKHFKI